MDESVLVRIERPSRAELVAARKAMLAGGHTCGCYGQVSRNPFFSAVVAHFRRVHPDSLAVVLDAQAAVLLAMAQEATAEHAAPWRTTALPIPVKIG
jgi:hypothetical protein